jgi:hypothetical protein
MKGEFMSQMFVVTDQELSGKYKLFPTREEAESFVSSQSSDMKEILIIMEFDPDQLRE